MPARIESSGVRSRKEIALLIVADPEAQCDVAVPVFGSSILRRNLARAHQAGIAIVAALPGVHEEPDGLKLVSVGEPLLGPILMIFEGSSLSLPLLSALRRLARDENWDGEGKTIYDRAGRPAAYIGADRRRVPSSMPIEEGISRLEPIEGLGPWMDGSPAGTHVDHGDAIVRMVSVSDRRRIEAQLMADVGLQPQWPWHRYISASVLRGMGLLRINIPQWEFLALVLGLGGASLVAFDRWWCIDIGVLLAAVGVEISLLLPRWVRLQDPPPGHHDGSTARSRTQGLLGPGVALANAVRPITHAALFVALSYAWVAETGERLRLLALSVAELAVFIVGILGASLMIAHARSILRGGGWGHDLQLARLDRFLARLGFAVPLGTGEIALLEISIAIAGLTGQLFVAWWILAVASASRLWRWALRPVSPPSGAA